MLSRKGQSTLEYVIVLTAIIAVVIVVAGSTLKNHTQASLDHVTGQMETQVKKINYGGAAAPAGGDAAGGADDAGGAAGGD